MFFKICHLFTFNWNNLWLCFISPSQSCPSFSVLGLSCPLRVFFSLSCYVSYCLFLSLWVLLHDSHFLLCRCSSFLAYINFPCMGYISFPSESQFTFPNMCSLFSLYHKSVNGYEPECLTTVSKAYDHFRPFFACSSSIKFALTIFSLLPSNCSILFYFTALY